MNANRQAVSRRRIPPGTRAPAAVDVRLLAIDLDGTLLNDAKQISPQTTHALKQLATRGVKIVIASARPPRSVRHIYSQLQLDTWQINYNGALIWDEPARKAIYHRPIPGPMVMKLAALGRSCCNDAVVTCEILDRWYTDRADQPYTTETGRLFKPDVVAPLDQICSQPITKLLFLGPSGAMTRIEAALGTNGWHDHVSVVRTEPELLQIMDRRVGKSSALKMVAEHYKVPLRQVMAIGDAPNDVGMLQLAGIAVAMKNAHDIVKQHAHWIAPSNNDHGVHAALVKYGLCK
jgi:Cof subfamily protein (haloacid dehalogenase superfamily)